MDGKVAEQRFDRPRDPFDGRQLVFAGLGQIEQVHRLQHLQILGVAVVNTEQELHHRDDPSL